MAWADKFWSPQEEAKVTALLQSIGCTPQDIEELRTVPPNAPDQLEKTLPDRGSRLEVMRLLWSVALADGILQKDELDYLLNLGRRLELTPGELLALSEGHRA